MQTSHTFTAEIREGTGKGAARALRREGKIPAIIYGGKGGEVSISLDEKEIFMEWRKGGFKSRVLEIDAGKEKFTVIPRDIQRHPVSDRPVHADFQRIDAGTEVMVPVAVILHNHEKSPGIKRGGVLNIVRRSIRMICEAEKIPTHIDVDLAGLAIGDSIHRDDIDIPEGCRTFLDRNFTIVTVVGRGAAKKAEESESAEGEGEEGEGEEGSSEDSAESGDNNNEE